MAKKNYDRSILFKVKNKFKNAFFGIFIAIKEESSLIVHFLISFSIIGLGIWLKISYVKWAITITTIGIVLGFELINTMVENLVDVLSFEYNKKAKKIKDICAAAALLNSLIAAAVGFLIFLPPLIDKIQSLLN